MQTDDSCEPVPEEDAWELVLLSEWTIALRGPKCTTEEDVARLRGTIQHSLMAYLDGVETDVNLAQRRIYSVRLTV